MRWMLGMGLVWGVLAMIGFSLAQPPGAGQGQFGNQGGGKGGPGKGGPGKDAPGKGGPGAGRTSSVEEMVNRLMAFDKNQDGVLTKEELGDGRLNALFEKANSSKNGK